MIESIENGCSHGMNGNALSGNVCSMTPTTSGGQTIQDAVSVLNKLEAIEGQHHNPQKWSNQNRPHACSSYGRKDAHSETNICKPRTKTHEKI